MKIKRILLTIFCCLSIFLLIGCQEKKDTNKEKQTTENKKIETKTELPVETKTYEIDVTVVSVNLDNKTFVGTHEKYFDTKEEIYLTSVNDSVYPITDDYKEEIKVGDKIRLHYSYLTNQEKQQITFLGMEKL